LEIDLMIIPDPVGYLRTFVIISW